MITPMVARLVRDLFDCEGWLFELKWDGFRAIANETKAATLAFTAATRKISRNDFNRLPRH